MTKLFIIGFVLLALIVVLTAVLIAAICVRIYHVFRMSSKIGFDNNDPNQEEK